MRWMCDDASFCIFIIFITSVIFHAAKSFLPPQNSRTIKGVCALRPFLLLALLLLRSASSFLIPNCPRGFVRGSRSLPRYLTTNLAPSSYRPLHQERRRRPFDPELIMSATTQTDPKIIDGKCRRPVGNAHIFMKKSCCQKQPSNTCLSSNVTTITTHITTQAKQLLKQFVLS